MYFLCKQSSFTVGRVAPDTDKTSILQQSPPDIHNQVNMIKEQKVCLCVGGEGGGEEGSAASTKHGPDSLTLTWSKPLRKKGER